MPYLHPSVAFERKPRHYSREDFVGPPPWPPLDYQDAFGSRDIWEEAPVHLPPSRSQIFSQRELFSSGGAVPRREIFQRTEQTVVRPPVPQSSWRRIWKEVRYILRRISVQFFVVITVNVTRGYSHTLSAKCPAARATLL